MTRLPLVILPALVGLALAGTAFTALAAQVNLMASLSGTEEVPSNDSSGTGTLEATYDSDSNVLNYTVTYSGLTGDATAAHFHGPAAPGENASPILPIEGSLASPFSGTATLTDAQEADLLSGAWYFNIHTAQYPGGEIRGQVLQTASSGEASTLPSGMSSSSSMIDESSSSIDVSTSVSVSASVSVDPDTSSLSSAVSSASSAISSAMSSAVSSASSLVSSALDTSVSASGEVSVSGEVSTSAP